MYIYSRSHDVSDFPLVDQRRGCLWPGKTFLTCYTLTNDKTCANDSIPHMAIDPFREN